MKYLIVSTLRSNLFTFMIFSLASCRGMPQQGKNCVLLFLLILMSLTNPVPTIADTVNENAVEPADQFKHFIENPPPIADIFIEIQQPKQPSSFYHAKWQSQCVFVGCETGTNKFRLKTATNLVDYSSIYSKFKNIYWQKNGADFYCWTNSNLPKQATNSVTFANRNFTHWVVNQVLNGGADTLAAGTIRWTNDAFSCNASGIWYHGTLNRDKLGRAKNVNVEIGKIGQMEATGHLDYEYHYEKQLDLSFFPSRIEWIYTNHDGDVYTRTVIIHSIKVAPRLMTIDDFSLDPLLSTTNITDVITISNNFLATTPIHQGPGVLPSSVQDPMAAKLIVTPNYRRIYLCVATVILMSPFLIFLYSKTRK